MPKHCYPSLPTGLTAFSRVWPHTPMRSLFFGTLLGLAVLAAQPAMAQERAVLAVVDTTGTKASKVRTKFRKLVASTAHSTLTEAELIVAGDRAGVRSERFWTQPDKLERACGSAQIDAVVVSTMSKSKRKYRLKVEVLSGRSGKSVGSFEVNLGKKPRIGSGPERKILEELEPLVQAALAVRPPVAAYVAPVAPPPVVDAPDLSASAFGHPLFTANVGFDTSWRGLSVKVPSGYGANLEYSSSVYPLYGAQIGVFPLARHTHGVGSGLGLTLRGAYGALDTHVPVPVGVTLDEAPDCSSEASGESIVCPTSHLEIEAGLVFDLLLRRTAEGDVDPTGMAVTFGVSYASTDFDVAHNAVYEGHSYQGVRLAGGFSTPLGLDALRLQLEGSFVYPLGFGDATMVDPWGTAASGHGLGGSLALSYAFLDGLWAQLGYRIETFETTYTGDGCQYGSLCQPTRGGAASDAFHHVSARIGLSLN